MNTFLSPIMPLLLGSVLAFSALSFHHGDSAPVSHFNDGTILIAASKNVPLIYLKKVEAGSFNMGAAGNTPDAYGNEFPVHRVTLKKYAIAKTEVTQELWEAVMGNNPSFIKGEQYPVTNVSWNDCQEFLRRYNALPTTREQGLTFRLPTEAEWEYAARGGSSWNNFIYAGSNDAGAVAWYGANSTGSVHEVGKKAYISEPFDVYDMSGNVSEWVQDKNTEYLSLPQENPCMTEGNAVYVHRGGNYRSALRDIRITARRADTATYRASDLGFRLAVDL